ncbi:uncharacterized protein LOC128246897 [Mya arenaria]|uniref:uncharacterized protein LOC128246897 n=1 Tax=Mya arenaria TaxID=6604 RepID=UPI0022E6E408|nr:uncharacterized protein LOC128246897 [Mya arenaria]XP_052821394.1 uncharacterized protein LOC128246897 [Mya arenaria]XP_052821395.1 uncharacterized protein LOC128246897 [Mya arenaria]XP_052821396.1 uncharacterized protein LOC128246897 [Mya arenaria]
MTRGSRTQLVYLLFKLRTLLEDKTELINQPEAQRAVEQLKKLELDDFKISAENKGEILKEEVDNQIPTEANRLDENKLGMIVKALGEGHEEVQRIRAMVVGMFSVGKTSLVNNLIDTSKNIRPPHDNIEQYPQSTVGIDVHLCKIENEKWKKLAFMPKRNIRRRIENSIEKQEETQEETMDVLSPGNVPDHIEKVKKYIEQDDIEYRKEIAKIAHTTAHEGIKAETDTHENPPLVSVWDFAGQNLYYSTHHFFFNKRSIYLLVMNMTKELDDVVEESKSVAGLVHEHFTSLDIFKFWLNSINMYSSIRDQEQECKPTVILIGTHRDQMKGSEEHKEDRMHAFFNKALNHFPDSSILRHVHCTKFLVNNLDAKNPVFDEIRNEVKKLAEVQPYWNEKYPLKWIQLEKTFEQMREQGKVIVKLRDVEAANGENPEPLGGDELQLFLEMQHMYGNILYFDSEELKNHVMLSPEWTIEAFKCFISHKEKHVPPTLVNEWERYKESAILEPQLLKTILEHSDPQIKENADVVVEYMKHLDIMAKPIHLEDYEEQYEEGQNDHNGSVDPNYRGSICTPLHSCSNFHILPCLLNAKPEGNLEEMKNPPNWHNTKAVCFVFKNNFMPRSIFHRLLAACIRNWEIAKLKGKRLLYNGFGVFKVKQAQLRIWYDDHIIYARMSFMSKHKHKRQAIDPGVCGDVRRTLYMNLMAIVSHLPRSNDFTKTTPFEEYVQCPKLNKHNCGLFRVNDLLQDVELICGDDHEENIQHHTMQIDKYWYSDILTKMKKEETTFEGVSLDIVPTNQHLNKIALCLRKNKRFGY